MTITGRPAPSDAPSGPMPRRPGTIRARLTRRVLTPVIVAVVVTTGASYVQALTYPGNAGFQVRTVGWIRDHGGSGLVDVVENWWYAHNAPTGAAPPSAALPAVPAAVPAPVTTGAQPPPLVLLAGSAPLPGEAQWAPGPQRVGGVPAMYTGYFRPDPAYPSQIVGVAWMDQTLVGTHLIGGTREPGGTWPEHAQVPAALRPALVAAFNSGWLMRDAHGGYYAHGRTAFPLRDGAASLVIDTSGRMTVGQWGRDAQIGPQIVAVRQNLDLVVDHGQPVAGLADNSSGRWGSTRNQFQYTWRSALGTDQAGNLVYLAGDQLNLAGLARAMVAAGVVRGMELDIHPAMVTFTTFQPSSSGSAGAKLLPTMSQPSTRYLSPDQRDFLAVTLRASGSGAATGGQ